MKQLQFPIILVTVFAIVYNLLPYFGANENQLAALFIISPFAVIWMVYRILKDGVPSGKTWDDYFYEDHPYKRNGKEDINSGQ